MQITRERVVGEIAKLTAERAQHLAHIEQNAANVNCVDGCLIECRAMLAILDTPEPETDEQREARERDAGMARAKPPNYCTTDGATFCKMLDTARRCVNCPERVVDTFHNPQPGDRAAETLDAAPGVVPADDAPDMSLVERDPLPVSVPPSEYTP